jgi:hypothetical protein
MSVLSWPISPDRTHLPRIEEVEAVARSVTSSTEITLAFEASVHNADANASFKASSAVQRSLLPGHHNDRVRAVIDRHVAGYKGAGVEIARRFRSWDQMATAIRTSAYDEVSGDSYIRDFADLLFALDTPEMRAGVEMPMGMVVFEGRQHTDLDDEMVDCALLGPGCVWTRRRASCTSTQVKVSLDFANWRGPHAASRR